MISMAPRKYGPRLQTYPRQGEGLLAADALFPKCAPALDKNCLLAAIDTAFDRCLKNKQGMRRESHVTPEQLVEQCLVHLRERSDPILSPYLCAICVATPPRGILRGYDDRKARCNQDGAPYSLNCEVWGPGFIFPYLTGHSAVSIYLLAVGRVAEYLPFMTLRHAEVCAKLLTRRLRDMQLLGDQGRIDPAAFVRFCNQAEGA